MKRNYLCTCIIGLTGCLFLPVVIYSQDLHYADIPSMNIWYNPALKIDRNADLRLNFRNVSYQSLVAFRTAGALVTLPVNLQQPGTNGSNNYVNFTAGGTFDQSNAGIFKNNTFMLGISYAQQLSNNQTYLAAGFQGTNTRSVFGTYNLSYPDQFDQYGPLPTGTRDPLNVGRSNSWTSLHMGIAIFQNTDEKEWYIGSSLRHINKPYTNEFKTEANRLGTVIGLQAGLTYKNESDEFGVYGLANWQTAAYEYLIGTHFTKIISTAATTKGGNAIGAGIALRVRDAVIPNIQLRFNKTNIRIHYDINISGLKAAGYSRQAFELVFMQQLNKNESKN